MSMTSPTANQEAMPGSGEANTGGPVVVGGFRYVRAPVPLHFPEFEAVGESKRHLEQRTTLYLILKHAFAERAAVGSDQFVYWDPTDPRQCLSPDAFVRLGVPDELFRSWKVWERGAPEVAVEIISDSDARDVDWNAKLQKYRRSGVRELVRFDAEGETVSLRIWDALGNDLVERAGVERVAPSRCLPGAWVIVDDSERRALLRLSQDPEGRILYPTPSEQAEQAQGRADDALARAAAAEQRIRELEAELGRRR